MTGNFYQQTHAGIWLEQRTVCRLLAACKQARCPYVCTPAAVLLEAPPQPPQVCALSRWAAPATQEPV